MRNVSGRPPLCEAIFEPADGARQIFLVECDWGCITFWEIWVSNNSETNYDFLAT